MSEEETYQNIVVDESEDDSTEQTANDEPVEEAASDEPTEQDKVQKRIDKAIYEKHQARRELEQAKAEAAEIGSPVAHCLSDSLEQHSSSYQRYPACSSSFISFYFSS
jgi:uncharacterized protein YqfA (UPF0365 family)